MAILSAFGQKNPFLPMDSTLPYPLDFLPSLLNPFTEDVTLISLNFIPSSRDCTRPPATRLTDCIRPKPPSQFL